LTGFQKGDILAWDSGILAIYAGLRKINKITRGTGITKECVMKDTSRLFGTLGLRLCVIVLALAVGLGLAACDNGTTSSGGGGKEDEEVTLLSVTANNPSGTTTQLALVFDKEVKGLVADDVKLAGTEITKGSLSGSGVNYTLGVTVKKAGSVTVSVTKAGYRVAGTRSVDVYYAAAPGENDIKVTFADLKANGNATDETTWKLFIKLDKRIPGLAAGDIKISSDGSNRPPSKGGLYVEDNEDGSAAYTLTIYNFGVTNKTAKLTVGIEKIGYYIADTQTVDIYAHPVVYEDGPTEASYSVHANNDGTRTTNLTIVFDVLISNLQATDITLVNVSGAGGVSRGALSAPSFEGDKWYYTLGSNGDFAHRAKMTVVIRKNGYKMETTETDQAVEFINVQSVTWDASVDSDSAAETTKKIFLEFSGEVVGLAGGDITLAPDRKQGLVIAGRFVTIDVFGFHATEEVTVTVSGKEGYYIFPENKKVTLYFAAPKADTAALLAEVLRSIPAGAGPMEVAFSGTDLTGVKNAIDMATPSGVQLTLILSGAITKIEEKTFSNCEKLEVLQLPSTVTEIEAGAFTNAKLKELVVGGALATAPAGALDADATTFKTLTLKATPAAVVKIPASINTLTLGDATVVAGNFPSNDPTTIKTLTLNGNSKAALSVLTGVTGITIGKDFTSAANDDLAGANFSSLNSLSAISVNADNAQYSSVGGVLLNKLGTALISYPKAKTDINYDLPSTVTTIQTNAFGSTSITSMTISSALTSAAAAVFPSNADFNTLILRGTPSATAGAVVFPGNVTNVTLGGNATVVAGNFTGSGDPFVISGVTSLTLNGAGVPAAPFFNALNVASLAIGSDFNGVPATGSTIGSSIVGTTIDTITVDPQNAYFVSNDGVLLNKAGTTLVRFPAGKESSGYTIPTGVKTIGVSAFEGCDDTDFTAISIPASVSAISASAFKDSKGLATVTFTATAPLTIGDSAFEGCIALAAPTLTTGITSIGEKAFKGCAAVGFASIEIPNTVSSIGKNAFEGCTNLATVTFAATDTTNPGIAIIEADTFKDTVIVSITLPPNLTTIKAGAFSSTLTTLTVTGTKLATIEAGALPASCVNVVLTGTPAAAARFPATVRNVTLDGGTGNKANFDAAIGDIKVIVNGWTEGALDGFAGLTKLELSSSFSALLTGDHLAEVTTITELTVASGNQTYAADGNTLFGLDASTHLIKETLIRYYPSAADVVTYAVPASVVTIADGAFKGANLSGAGLTVATSSDLETVGEGAFVGANITIANFANAASLATIGEGAFKGTGLVTLTLDSGGSGIAIGKEAFMDCIALTPPTLIGVATIGESAFMNCTVAGFSTITIPTTVTSIGKNAFNGCTNLATLTIESIPGSPGTPPSLATIGDGAFVGTKITAVDFQDAPSVTIGTTPVVGTPVGAFEGITQLASVTFSTATVIGASSFKGCTGLAVPTLTGVTSIGADAFNGCTAAGFNTLTIPASVTSIGAGAFAGCDKLTTLTLAGTNPGIAAGAFTGTTLLKNLVLSGVLVDAGLTNMPDIFETLTFSAAQTVTTFAALTAVRTLVLDTAAQSANPVGLTGVTTLTLNFAQTETFATLTGLTTVELSVAQTSVFPATLTSLATVKLLGTTPITLTATNFASLTGLRTVDFSNAVHVVPAAAFGAGVTTVIFAGATVNLAAANSFAGGNTPTTDLKSVYATGAAGTYLYDDDEDEWVKQ
jgi:hypothetical protein